jgi:hypothetical protein
VFRPQLDQVLGYSDNPVVEADRHLRRLRVLQWVQKVADSQSLLESLSSDYSLPGDNREDDWWQDPFCSQEIIGRIASAIEMLPQNTPLSAKPKKIETMSGGYFVGVTTAFARQARQVVGRVKSATLFSQRGGTQDEATKH